MRIATIWAEVLHSECNFVLLNEHLLMIVSTEISSFKQ